MQSFSKILLLFFFYVACVHNCAAQNARLVEVDSGWANNSVNTVIFRKNALVSFGDSQFIAFYNQQHYVVLGKRRLGEDKWQLKQTPYQGNVSDAHNCISIMVDGKGYLHMAWDHHNNLLHYCKSIYPGSLELTATMPMTGKLEERVSYPEFYRLPNGNLLFFYRDGQSGEGNLVINKYDQLTGIWTQLQRRLIDGEGKRSAYWQACIDSKGIIHVSWVWRETPDVASNHDICYARSIDGGYTWEKSDGVKYQLPITQASAEYAGRVSQHSDLINQTSMSTDADGHPYIASYWREGNSKVPQYHLVYLNQKKWQVFQVALHQSPFSLNGTGSKRIPMARPQVLIKGSGKKATAFLIFRDEERGSRISVATVKLNKKKVQVSDLTGESVGSWEPVYDTELWKEKGLIHLFVQKVEQLDAEGKADIPAQMVKVLEWKPY